MGRRGELSAGGLPGRGGSVPRRAQTACYGLRRLRSAAGGSGQEPLSPADSGEPTKLHSGSFPSKTHQGGQKETVFLDPLRRNNLFSLLVPFSVFFVKDT